MKLKNIKLIRVIIMIDNILIHQNEFLINLEIRKAKLMHYLEQLSKNPIIK